MDLFGPTADVIRKPGADLAYIRGAFNDAESASFLKALVEQVQWRHERISVWGREFDQPRMTAWYGDSGQNYSYSGIKLFPLPWTDTLLQTKRRVEECSDEHFNSVLLNYYRNERDSLGYHSDDEHELGPKPTIASLSFGAERQMRFKPKNAAAADSAPFSILLENGSLLIMRGETQKHWRHGIAKSSRPMGPRINLTFRKIHG